MSISENLPVDAQQLLTVEVVIVLVCVIVIAWSLGVLVSHGLRQVQKWMHARERTRSKDDHRR